MSATARPRPRKGVTLRTVRLFLEDLVREDVVGALDGEVEPPRVEPAPLFVRKIAGPRDRRCGEENRRADRDIEALHEPAHRDPHPPRASVRELPGDALSLVAEDDREPRNRGEIGGDELPVR